MTPIDDVLGAVAVMSLCGERVTARILRSGCTYRVPLSRSPLTLACETTCSTRNTTALALHGDADVSRVLVPQTRPRRCQRSRRRHSG